MTKAMKFLSVKICIIFLKKESCGGSFFFSSVIGLLMHSSAALLCTSYCVCAWRPVKVISKQEQIAKHTVPSWKAWKFWRLLEVNSRNRMPWAPMREEISEYLVSFSLLWGSADSSVNKQQLSNPMNVNMVSYRNRVITRCRPTAQGLSPNWNHGSRKDKAKIGAVYKIPSLLVLVSRKLVLSWRMANNGSLKAFQTMYKIWAKWNQDSLIWYRFRKTFT